MIHAPLAMDTKTPPAKIQGSQGIPPRRTTTHSRASERSRRRGPLNKRRPIRAGAREGVGFGGKGCKKGHVGSVAYLGIEVGALFALHGAPIVANDSPSSTVRFLSQKLIPRRLAGADSRDDTSRKPDASRDGESLDRWCVTGLHVVRHPWCCSCKGVVYAAGFRVVARCDPADNVGTLLSGDLRRARQQSTSGTRSA